MSKQSSKQQTIVRQYMARIGRLGGLRSRRSLSSDQARSMTKVREARRAFKRFKTLCFWSYNPDLKIGITDVPWVIETLMKSGNREAWEVATRLCR